MGGNQVKIESNFTAIEDASYSSHYEDESPKPLSWKITVGLTMSVIILVTLIGNLLVMISFATDWRLRINRGNWFILNLSVSDFLIGLCVLPINTAWIVNEGWPFGETFCKIWIVIDYTASYMSVLTMGMISLDRYWLVTKKLAYQEFLTKTKVRLMLGSAWLFCIIFYTIVTFLWSVISGETNIDYTEECEMESVYNLGFNIFLIIIEFVLPLIVIDCLNYRIYRIIKERSQQFVRSKSDPINSMSRPNNAVGPMPDPVAPPDDDDIHTEHSSPVQEKKEFKKHKRAAFTLGVLIGIFICCWLPYYITVILGTFCESCVPDSVWEFTNNLLWCNSTLNPFLYALLHNRYRQNFIRILGLKGLYQRWTPSDGEGINTSESMM
ncbi:5-hydroxytryptamine receptor 4-like [Amphiura filiformis]|uniref:5-hydroxytryptamine receptor 4-like n=1 Tax=Amphiura filiformis TaxID=82378 RepID=UPI003B218D1C